MAELQPGHRRVSPIDFPEALMARATLDEISEFEARAERIEARGREEADKVARAPLPSQTEKTTVAMEELLDPVTGTPLLGAVPANVAAILRDAFERLAMQTEARSRAEAEKVAHDLRDLPDEGAMIAGRLQTLMYLFTKAVADDGPNTPLTAASHLVIDTVETIAKELIALNDRASAIYRPLRDEQYGRAS